MSGYPIPTKAQSATLDDCARLLTTLRADYIPGLKIEIDFELGERSSGAMVLRLVDEVHSIEDPQLARSVWSELHFYNQLHLISCGSLFDLLIVGYRVIDRYFTTGVDNRPRPVKG